MGGEIRVPVDITLLGDVMMRGHAEEVHAAYGHALEVAREIADSMF